MTFTPHPEYIHLRTQALALVALVNSLEAQRDSLQVLLKNERAKKYPASQATVDSERAANSVMTDELERLHDRHERLRVEYAKLLEKSIPTTRA